MTKCQHCHAESQLFLCESCTTQLSNMLRTLPWLLDELDARIQKLDRIQLGTIGRNRRPDELNIIDFDAAETARKVRKTLLKWVKTVAERHTGRPIPALGTVSSKQLARWLYANLNAITALDIAGKLYNDIAHLAGTGNQHRGQLINAINPYERHFAGPCPTTTGFHDGEPTECGTILYADIDDTTTTCPTCKQPTNVENNRRRAAENRDLKTKQDLTEILNNIGEPITTQQLNRWITARRLRTHGWLHDGQHVANRINEHSQALYSVSRARKLRRRDAQLQRLRQEIKAR